MKYEFIDAEKACISIVRLCNALNVSRSGYYEWRSEGAREPSKRERENEELRRQVVRIHKESRGCYGRPRILRALRREGIRVGPNRLRRIMAQSGIWGRKRRKRGRSRGEETVDAPAPNLVERNFSAKRKNQVWCGDITQFKVGSEWLYVATVIDLFSRRVVGLSLGSDATTDLTVRAMLDAFRRRGEVHGTVFHSDRGTQYRSTRFRRLTASRGIVQSMSRGGNCLDNAVAESFFATLEHELASRSTWASATQAEEEIRNFVFAFYNRRRMHSANDFLSPTEFEDQQAA